MTAEDEQHAQREEKTMEDSLPNLISKVTVCSPQLKVLTIVVESFKSCNQGASNYPLAVHFVDK